MYMYLLQQHCPGPLEMSRRVSLLATQLLQAFRSSERAAFVIRPEQSQSRTRNKLFVQKGIYIRQNKWYRYVTVGDLRWYG